MNDAVVSEKPNLYRGQVLPLGSLSPDQFQDFVFETLSEIGTNHGFQITSGRQPSFDGGFDVTGERVGDRAIVCVQCKRLAGPLYQGAVGIEFAKVALQSAVEGSIVKEHYFITSGEVAGKLRSAERQLGRAVLVAEARTAALSHDDLKTLRVICQEKGIDPAASAESYVRSLEKIRIWSGRDFDGELGRVWSKISSSLSRFFSVDVLLAEYPRPDLNVGAYLERAIAVSESCVDLVATQSELPMNISRQAPSDPVADLRAVPPPKVTDDEILDVTAVLAAASIGWCTVLSGPGGAGKSTTLQRVVRSIAKQLESGVSGALPILVRLSRYNGSIDDLIHSSLGIHYGHWRSIPGNFILLCDGLDEVPAGGAQKFLDELGDLIQEGRLAVVVSVRDAGLRQPVSFAQLGSCWRLAPLSYRLCFQIAEKLIPNSKYPDFLKEFRHRMADLGPELLTLPFGFTSAVRSFLERGVLPERLEQLIGDVFERRIGQNRSRVQVLAEPLREIPDSTLRRLAEAVAFELRVVQQKAAVEQEGAQAIVVTALERIKSERVFGAENISDVGALSLVSHYEILAANPDGMMHAGHDIVADYLAGAELARNWRSRVRHLQSTLAQDSWVYAAPHVMETEKREFLEAICSVDIVLGARCAAAMGPAYYAVAEAQILTADAQDSKVMFARAASAMAVLKSPVCLTRLCQRRGDRDINRNYHAERALAVIGDVPVLEASLQHNEPLVSSGLGVSGGNFDMWHAAPPIVRTEIARTALSAALASGNEAVVLSLQTIAAFGDHSDLSVVEGIVRRTENIPTFYAGVNCLYEIDRVRTLSLLQQMLVQEGKIPSIFAMEKLSGFGCELDTTVLLREFVAVRDVQQLQFPMFERAVKLLSKHPLPENGSTLLRNAYEGAGVIQRANIWGIATAHRLDTFDTLAMAILSGGNPDELGYAANFGKARFISELDREKFAALCEERVVDLESDIWQHCWHFKRLLDALLSVGRKRFVADVVSRIFGKYLPEHLRVNREWKSRLRSGDLALEEATKLQYNFFAQFDLCGVLMHAAEIADMLPSDVVRAAVHFNIDTAGDEIRGAYIRVVSELSEQELDAEIAAIDDPFERVLALGYLRTLGATPARLRMLISDLPKVIHWHLCYSGLAGMMPVYWCDSLAEALIKTIADSKWPGDFGAQMFHDVERAGANLMTADVARRTIAPLLAGVSDPAAREILQFWHDIATTRRAQ